MVKRFSTDALEALSVKELKSERALVGSMKWIYQCEYSNFISTAKAYLDNGDERLAQIFARRARFAKNVINGADKALSRIDAELLRRGLE